jgi:hypothetical protein
MKSTLQAVRHVVVLDVDDEMISKPLHGIITSDVLGVQFVFGYLRRKQPYNIP